MIDLGPPPTFWVPSRPAIICSQPLIERRIGLSYALIDDVCKVAYENIVLPKDCQDAQWWELIGWLPHEVHEMPRWVLQSILMVNPLVGFGAGGVTVGPPTITFLTSTSASNQTWSVLAEWNSGFNKAECLSHAGNGGNGGTSFVDGPCCCDFHSGGGGGGGGGGGYAKALNISLTPSGSMTFHLEAGGAGAATGQATWANAASLAASGVGICGAANGSVGGNATGGDNGGGGAAGAGASTTSAVGSTLRAGGSGAAGFDGNPPNQNFGAGGGGAAGPTGVGGAGSGTTGGTGDGGTTAAGAAGTQFDATHGSGGGANGVTNQGPGVQGGLYGGGASGGTSDEAGAAGRAGLIVLTNNSN